MEMWKSYQECSVRNRSTLSLPSFVLSQLECVMIHPALPVVRFCTDVFSPRVCTPPHTHTHSHTQSCTHTRTHRSEEHTCALHAALRVLIHPALPVVRFCTDVFSPRVCTPPHTHTHSHTQSCTHTRTH